MTDTTTTTPPPSPELEAEVERIRQESLNEIRALVQILATLSVDGGWNDSEITPAEVRSLLRGLRVLSEDLWLRFSTRGRPSEATAPRRARSRHILAELVAAIAEEAAHG